MFNNSLDTASIESMKEALAKVSIEEADRAKHYKGATPPEDMKNNRKGKGAQDMMKPADDAAANPNDTEKKSHDDASKAGRTGPSMKKRSNDNSKGDKKVVPSGTPMKDPAGPVKTTEAVDKTKLGEKVAGGVAKGKPGMKAFKRGESPFQKRIKKITGKSKLDSPHMQPQKEKANEGVDKTKPQWIIDAYAEMDEAMTPAQHRASRTRAGLPARPTAYSNKEIEKMAKDKKYKGNTSGLERAIRKYAGKRFDNNAFIQKTIKKHAETNETKMDPVGKADADIDNDGDVDSSDKYLHNRRKAIKKAISKK